MATLLSDDLVVETLTALPGWSGDSRALTRELHLPGNLDAELRRQIAVDATAMGHQPTVVDLPDGTLFRLSTDEVGGVSELDVALASHISDLAHRLQASEPGVDAVRSADDVIEVSAPMEQVEAPVTRLVLPR
jgi:4a-hydroxytetrahydrobiopterin dehydratase